jgi:hypothetical protein
MLTCPLCKKSLPALERRCRTCQTDVSLLVDYVGHLHDGLTRAEAHTRRGDLGAAVWAYLEVLDVDPDNATARRQVGQVAAAVRQFDRAAARPWRQLGRKGSIMRFFTGFGGDSEGRGWLLTALWTGLALLALVVGYGLGYHQGSQAEAPPDKAAPTSPEGETGLPKETNEMTVFQLTAGRVLL